MPRPYQAKININIVIIATACAIRMTISNIDNANIIILAYGNIEVKKADIIILVSIRWQL